MSKQILGITDGTQESGISIVNHDKITFSINEERITRKKKQGSFPSESIKLIKPKNIDEIVVASISTPEIYLRIFRKIQRRFSSNMGIPTNYINPSFKDYIADFYRRVIDQKIQNNLNQIKTLRKLKICFLKKIIRNQFRINAPVYFVKHHLAHASAAFFTSGLKRSLIITADMEGDGFSMKAYVMTQKESKCIYCVKPEHSYGAFYAAITSYLGFTPFLHEGKITGLAAYGNTENVKVEFPFNIIKNKPVFTKKNGLGLRKFLKKLEHYKKEDIAAWLQKNTENQICNIIKSLIISTKIKNICLSGGLFANVKLNQRIHELPEVNSVYIFPNMSDGGLALGATLAHTKPTPKKLENIYLGPTYSDKRIKETLEQSRLKYKKYNNIEKEIAKLLSKGKVVARFNGAMEYGPRALGNRSILYQTTDKTVNEWLNKKLNRTEFMPFAPATLWEKRKECYKNIEGAENTARYMTICFNCTDKMKKQSPGVVHIDGTARPQIVKKEDNKSFHKIITEYHKITGIPSIINTSFNMHEEPIVMTPKDAIRAFKDSKIDHLAIGTYLI